MASVLYFAVPGDIDTRTGGTLYDKSLMLALRARGWTVHHLAWPAGFPFPDDDERLLADHSLAALPDGALVLIDGLACGVLPEALRRESGRLKLMALVHHPVALETGLSEEAAAELAAAEREALSFVSSVIVTSPTTAQTLASDYGVAPYRIAVAEPGVAFSAPLRGARPPGPVRLLSIGSVIPRKDHRTLVHALSLLKGLDWRCAIVGSLERSPHTAQALAAQIKAVGLADRIRLPGEADETQLEALYADADLFVLPSLYEGYGMVFAEALRCGLPIIATRAGAIPDVVPRGAGLLVEPGDADALAFALRRLILDESQRTAMAKRALKAGARFGDWDRTATLVEGALRQA